jgi:hypothetical protein
VQHTRGVPRPRGSLRNSLRRQVVVEVSQGQ